MIAHSCHREEVVKLAETIQKLIELRREEGTRAQVRIDSASPA